MEPIIIEELARMLEDQGEERGRAIGPREGEEIGRRAAIVDLAEAHGVPLDDSRRSWLARASLEELDDVRVVLKRDRAWPS